MVSAPSKTWRETAIKSLRVPAATRHGTIKTAKETAERFINAKVMNKKEKKWYDWGVSDAASYPKDHPDQLLQEAWDIFLTDIELSAITFSQLIELFPFYRKGLLETTKFYN